MKAFRITTWAIACVCALTLAFAVGCSDDDEDYYDDEEASANRENHGLTLVVDQQTGDMTITRPEAGTAAAQPVNTNAANQNPWTIYVYLCGSDLESDQACATDDLDEMVSASDNSNVRFVVEAGGSRSWHNKYVNAKKTQRLIIQDGTVEKLETLDRSNMGESNTLADFLAWGTATYPSDHNGVILWDHGGGSVNGVCLDENYNSDALSLKELDAALLSAYGTMNGKFDFIGFDACLMGTLETANVLASYAEYMYASEEMEPGAGWDYKSISDCLSKNPQTSAADLGKAICNGYFDSLKGDADEGIATLSIIDLGKVDAIVTSFNDFSRDLCNAAGNPGDLSTIVRGINEADNYGGNNRSEGYSNMVDLIGVMDACEPIVTSSSKVKSAVKDAVIYNKAGSTHSNAGGLSIYYPLMVEDSNELAMFEKVCVSPYYLTFVDTVERTSAQDAGDALFDFDSWFQDDEWEWSSDYEDDDSGWFNFDSDSLNEEHWNYENESQETGKSPLITFDKKPGFDKDGYYGFVLSKKALDYATSVSAYVYERWDDGRSVELGETIDVDGDWDTGSFYDAFNGMWLSLPDGQNLATYVAETTDDYVIYACPISLNGDYTNLRIRQYYDGGKAVVEGVWDGIDSNGMAARSIGTIEKGDVIIPLYFSEDNEKDDPDIMGDEYKVGGSLDVTPMQLQGNKYEYCFIIDDVYGDYYMTDAANFEVDDNGEVSYIT